MQVLLIISFLFTLFVLHQSMIRLAESLPQYLIQFFISFVACVIPVGYVLSALNRINQVGAWAVGVPIIAIALLVAIRRKPVQQVFSFAIFNQLKALSPIEKAIFGMLFGSLVVCSIINFIVVLSTAPNEWDSMTGHLVKCAYYLQHGNMNRLNGTTWTIDYYPNSLPTLQIYFYQLFQSEKGFKVIHYLSYWIFPVAMYGISRKIGQPFKASLFVALLASLLPSTLVQASTTETDLIFTAYLACVVYFLFKGIKAQRHKGTKLLSGHQQVESRKPKAESNIIHASYLSLAAAIWISHKSTFILVSPALAVVSVFCLWHLPIRKFLILGGLFLVFCAIYVLPNGYLANIQAEKRLSPSAISAPKSVMAYHSIESFSKREVLKYGTKNVFRYAFDFFSLDGIKSTEIGKKLNDAMRAIPIRLAQKLDLEENVFWVVNPFYFEPKFPYHKERPYWGVISFLLVLPMMILAIYRTVAPLRLMVASRSGTINISRSNAIKISRSNATALLLFACIVHYLSLSFTAHYDPIKGRYFLNMAVWALPLAGLWFQHKPSKYKSYYLLFCAVFVAVSAISTLLFRTNYPVIAEVGKKPFFGMSRIEQLTHLRPDFYPAYQKADSLVPKNATLAVALISEDFEYPLWGEHLTRKLIPIKPFNQNIKVIPNEADYLFYTKGLVPYQVGDIQLNEGDRRMGDTPMPENVFYLRKL